MAEPLNQELPMSDTLTHKAERDEKKKKKEEKQAERDKQKEEKQAEREEKRKKKEEEQAERDEKKKKEEKQAVLDKQKEEKQAEREEKKKKKEEERAERNKQKEDKQAERDKQKEEKQAKREKQKKEKQAECDKQKEEVRIERDKKKEEKQVERDRKKEDKQAERDKQKEEVRIERDKKNENARIEREEQKEQQKVFNEAWKKAEKLRKQALRQELSKKRKHPEPLDSWEAFTSTIKHWQSSVSPDTLKLSLTFHLDELPVSFAKTLEKDLQGNHKLNDLNNALGELVHIIRVEGGFRFNLEKKIDQKSNIYHIYRCSQDLAKERKSCSKGIREVRRMERFDCKSLLTFKVSIDDRLLHLRLQHNHHQRYLENIMSPEVLTFVINRLDKLTPGQIYQELLGSSIPGIDQVVQHQIYYQWCLRNSQRVNA